VRPFDWTARKSISPAECQQNATLARRALHINASRHGWFNPPQPARRPPSPLGTRLRGPHIRADERVLDHAPAPV